MIDGMIEGAFYAEMGKKLWRKRVQRNWSRAALAEEVGCHRNTVERWETGDGISVWMLLRVCDILCCQHLLMLPSREFTWGGDYQRMRRERDQMCKAVQSERDPRMSDKEEAQLRARRTA